MKLSNFQLLIFVLCPTSYAMADDLKGQHLKIAISGVPPFTIKMGNNVYSGVDPKIMEIVAKKMGFTYSLEWGRFWGAQNPDGSWAGVVGYVKNGTHSVGLGHVLLQKARYEAVDYVLMYAQPHHLMAPVPKAASPFWNILRPFTARVWMVILMTLWLTVTITVFLNRAFDFNRAVMISLKMFGSQLSQSTYSKNP